MNIKFKSILVFSFISFLYQLPAQSILHDAQDDSLKQRRSDFQQTKNKTIKMENLFAWCIVPYDSKNRTPEQRIEMLKELGIKSYAYDWREKHLSEMEHEWILAAQNNIIINAVWMWIDADWDKPGFLNSPNEKIFETLKKVGLKTQIWVGINANYFQGFNDTDAVMQGVSMIKYLNERANAVGCKIALYNHGDWFGEPENQIKIINALPEYKMGMIYNFHHGHTHIERFNELVKKMVPYLWAVNLNGMKKEGPKILPIGDGDCEKSMIQNLLDAGFDGPFGIIGHLENEDVKEVLIRNINGLKSLGF